MNWLIISFFIAFTRKDQADVGAGAVAGSGAGASLVSVVALEGFSVDDASGFVVGLASSQLLTNLW